MQIECVVFFDCSVETSPEMTELEVWKGFPAPDKQMAAENTMSAERGGNNKQLAVESLIMGHLTQNE